MEHVKSLSGPLKHYYHPSKIPPSEPTPYSTEIHKSSQSRKNATEHQHKTLKELYMHHITTKSTPQALNQLHQAYMTLLSTFSSQNIYHIYII